MRIGDDARKCVVFFGVPGDGGKIEYGGTGFLVTYRVPEYDQGFAYLVTARHVAKALEKWGDEGFHLRVNMHDGTSTAPIIVVIEWHYHPDPTVDLAAVSFSLGGPKFDQRHYALVDTTWADHTIKHMVACGDVVNLVGLFRLHAGNKRNVPIVHSGHIALMPDPNELVPVRDSITGKIIDSEVFLVEAQTLDGLSGSPVFIHETVDLEFIKTNEGATPKAYGGVRFLGIYTGSWDGEPGAILEADRNLKGGKRVPIGMGTVVPAKKLIEMLRDHPKMKKNRDKYIQDRKAEKAATQDSALPAPPATDENPMHREDFTSLVDVAARKQKPTE